MSFAAALLDELMGRNRNLDPSENQHETKWNDPDVCKYFLCGFCPYDLFTNTRADLGTCDKLHDEKLKKNYEESARHGNMGYEEDFVMFLQNLLSDVDRRIKRGHSRLALNNTPAPTGTTGNKEEEIELLTKKINDLVKEAEELGCEGKVEESQGVMKLCEQLQAERTTLENAKTAENEKFGGGELAKKMVVCEICGALLVANDAPQRIDEHLMGKQHMGFAQIRRYLEDQKKRVINAETDRENRLKREREEREQEREREKEERRKRQEEREKEREREREERRKRRRSRSRSRDRRHRRHRSHSRDRHRRSRSWDRDRHRRHRSRSRDRSRRSSHSSRDKDSHHHSRDKDRKSREHRSEDRRSREHRSEDRRSREHRSEDRRSRDKRHEDYHERKSHERNEHSEQKQHSPSRQPDGEHKEHAEQPHSNSTDIPQDKVEEMVTNKFQALREGDLPAAAEPQNDHMPQVAVNAEATLPAATSTTDEAATAQSGEQ